MSPASAVLVAVTTFIATNVDDFVILTSLFSMRPPIGTLSSRRIVIGQYVGFIALVALSLLAAIGLRIVPDRHVRWFGLIPLVLGIHGLVRHRGGNGDQAALIVTSTA